MSKSKIKNAEWLVETAKRFMVMGQTILKSGRGVCPQLVTVNSRTNQAVMTLIQGETDADERNAIIRALIKECDADGMMHFGDTNIRDTDMNIIGEQLMAIIQFKGVKGATIVSCRYTRNPFKFDEVEVRYDESGFVRPIWDEEGRPN